MTALIAHLNLAPPPPLSTKTKPSSSKWRFFRPPPQFRSRTRSASASFHPVQCPVDSSPLPLGVGIGRTSAIVFLAASLLVADPAFAFKGGGPYGIGVTRGQDLSGKDFSGKTLVKQDFKTSILRQASFKGAKLLGASFFDADLTGADLSDADLRGADFSLANVTKANLSNANLEGALTTGNTSFKGSNIYGADFTDVPLREDQREYLCKFADGVNSVTGNATRETLLCN